MTRSGQHVAARYCYRGHWITTRTDYVMPDGGIECQRCTDPNHPQPVAALGSNPWDEATLAPDAELAADLAAVRAAVRGWPLAARLRLGLRMQDGSHPFPGGRA